MEDKVAKENAELMRQQYTRWHVRLHSGVLVEEFDGMDPDRAKGRKPDAVIEN